MKRYALFIFFCAILAQPSWADWMVLDSSDTQDWVRVMEQHYPKYKDTMIRPTALLKFDTDDIPSPAAIQSAYLIFYVTRSEPGATITLSYVTDDSWSFDLTEAEDLYNWPVKAKMATYETGYAGYKIFDLTKFFKEDLHPKNVEPGASTGHFSLKITPDGPYFPWERIASPGFYEGDMRPYIHVQYSVSATEPLPDLSAYGSSIETDPVWPKPDSKVELKAMIRNRGAVNAYDVRVNFFDGDPDSGGLYLGYDVIPYIAGGGGDVVPASISWHAAPGRHLIHVVVDPLNSILETDELNNRAANTIPVQDGYAKYSDGFEFGFGDWIYDFDTPKEYMTGRNRLSFMHTTRDEVFKGKQSLFAFLDGTGDDGTVWIERAVPVPRYTNISVELSFAFGIQSDLATVLMYFMDVYDPEVEVDFSDAGMSNGWKVYSFKKMIYTGNSNRLWLGGGFTARWETALRKYMDEFKITLTTVD